MYGQNWQSNKSDQVIENKTQLAFEQRRTAEQPQPQLQPSADRVTEVCEDTLSAKQVDRQNVLSGQQLIDVQKEVRRPDGKRRIIPLSFSSGSKPTRLPSGSMFRDSNCVAAPLDSLSAPTTAAPLPPDGLNTKHSMDSAPCEIVSPLDASGCRATMPATTPQPKAVNRLGSAAAPGGAGPTLHSATAGGVGDSLTPKHKLASASAGATTGRPAKKPKVSVKSAMAEGSGTVASSSCVHLVAANGGAITKELVRELGSGITLSASNDEAKKCCTLTCHHRDDLIWSNFVHGHATALCGAANAVYGVACDDQATVVIFIVSLYHWLVLLYLSYHYIIG